VLVSVLRIFSGSIFFYVGYFPWGRILSRLASRAVAKTPLVSGEAEVEADKRRREWAG